MSKDAYYFSHDSNARNDVRMIKLRRMGGLECVGLFWCVIEMLREAEGYELPIETIDDICYEFRIDVAKFELLFICELLTQNKTVFYSNSLKDRMVKLDEIREKRAIAGQKGGKCKANAKQMLSKNSIVKQSKEDNNIYNEFVVLFNTITQRQFKGTDNSKRQFNARIKEGFTLDDFKQSIANCFNDEWHKQNTKYLTPDFITRSDKLQMYLNKTIVKGNNKDHFDYGSMNNPDWDGR